VILVAVRGFDWVSRSTLRSLFLGLLQAVTVCGDSRDGSMHPSVDQGENRVALGRTSFDSPKALVAVKITE